MWVDARVLRTDEEGGCGCMAPSLKGKEQGVAGRRPPLHPGPGLPWARRTGWGHTASSKRVTESKMFLGNLQESSESCLFSSLLQPRLGPT